MRWRPWAPAILVALAAAGVAAVLLLSWPGGEGGPSRDRAPAGRQPAPAGRESPDAPVDGPQDSGSPDGEPPPPDTVVRRSGPRPLVDRVRVEHPLPGQAVVSPLVVTGEAPGPWYFEADFPLRMVAGDGRVLSDTFATARGEWMTSGPVPFRAVLRLPSEPSPATLLLVRANASGLPAHDAEVGIPLRLAGADVPRVYFPNSVLDPQAVDCSRVFPVARPGSSGPGDGEAVPEAARRLLAALLEGPRPAERSAGYHTAVPEGAGVRSVAVRDGTLRVDFDRGMSEGVGGSCRVQAIRAQVDSTLARVPGVRRVEIAVEGSVEEALQP